jgi:hypothetical protein
LLNSAAYSGVQIRIALMPNAAPQPPRPKRIFSRSAGTARGLRSAWRRGLAALSKLDDQL